MAASAVWLLAGVLAPNEPARVALDWEAPADECPRGAAVSSEIEALLSEAGAPASDPVAASGRAAQSDSGRWTVTIAMTLADARTERVIEGESCRELSSAAAFIIATAVDPRVATLPVAAPKPPPPDSEPEVLPAPKPQRVPDPEPDHEPQPERVPDPETPRDPSAAPERAPSPEPDPPKLRWALGLLGGVGWGPNPTVGGVVGGALGLLGRRFRAELLGQYWTPSQAASAQNQEVGVSVQAWHLVGRGCGVPRWRSLEFPLCLGLAGGAIHGRGTGDLVVDSARVGWIAATAGPSVLFRLSERFAAGAGVDGFATIATGAFHTDPSGLAHQPRAGGFSAAARIELRLP